MASIYERKNKDGTSSWRVLIRRKGLKTFCTVFATKRQAVEFVDKYEWKYCLDPENFDWDKLYAARVREFST